MLLTNHARTLFARVNLSTNKKGIYLLYAFCAAAVYTLAIPFSALAGVTVTATQIGNDVFFEGSGTFDIGNLTLFEMQYVNSLLNPEKIVLLGDTADAEVYYKLSNFSGSTNFGPGTDYIFDDATSGDTVGVVFFPEPGLDEPAIFVPAGYASNDQLSGSSTYANQTFNSLGITPGSYTWTWDTNAGSDFFTLNVVPEPASLVLMGLCGLGFLSLRRRERSL